MIVARCVPENPSGVAAEGIAGDWWNVTYRAPHSLDWAAAPALSTFPDELRRALEAVGATVPAAKPISDIEFQGQFIQGRPGNGCELPPRRLSIRRARSASWNLPAYSGGNLAAALARATVDGAPFGSMPWHRPAFELRFPEYFADRGSGTKTGGGRVIDPTTSAELELEAVEFRTNAPQMVRNPVGPAVTALTPSSPEDSITEPTSRDIDRAFSTLVIPHDPPILLAGPGSIPEPSPGVNPGISDAGEVEGSDAMGGSSGSSSATDRIGPLGVVALGAAALVLLRRR